MGSLNLITIQAAIKDWPEMNLNPVNDYVYAVTVYLKNNI
jgi:hypothetical protein